MFRILSFLNMDYIRGKCLNNLKKIMRFMLGTAMELINGKLVLFMKDNGERTRPMVKVHFGIKVVIFILENSFRIKHMATEFIFTKTGVIMRGSGIRMLRKDKVKKFGKMDLSTKVPMLTAVKMVMEFIHGLMLVYFRAIGMIIKSQVSADINGVMVANLKAILLGIICRVMASINGQTVEFTKGIFTMTKKMGTVSITIQMVGAIKDNGKTEYSMEMDNFSIPRAIPGLANGQTEREFNGLMVKLTPRQ